jgi:hypothetical protein
VGPPCQPPPSLSLLTFSPKPPVLTRPVALARAPDGTAGHPAGPDAEPTRVRDPGKSSGEGKDPHSPLATQAGAPPAKGARPRRPLSPRVQSPCSELFCPCVALTGRHIPRGQASAGHPPTRIGVLPLSSVRRRKVRREWKVGEKGGGRGEARPHRDAADAPRPETATAATRRGEEAVRVGEGAGPEQEHPRCRVCLHRREHLCYTTVYPEPATTTPPPQREHHRGHLPLPSLLGFFSVLNQRRWGAPSSDLTWV